MVFGKKKDKPVTKADIEKMKAQAAERMREIEEQEAAIQETPQIKVTETPEKRSGKPVQSSEPHGEPDLPPPFPNAEAAAEAVQELFSEYGAVVGGGILPTDRDRVSVMLLFGIWTELKAIRKAAEEE